MSHLDPTRMVSLSVQSRAIEAETLAHLDGCAECRSRLAQETALSALIAQALAPTRVPELQARALERFQEVARCRRVRAMTALGAATLAVASIASIVGAVLFVFDLTEVVHGLAVTLVDVLTVAKVSRAVLSHVPCAGLLIVAPICAAVVLCSAALTRLMMQAETSH